MIKDIFATVTTKSPLHIGSDVSGTIRMPYMIHIPHEKEKFKIDKKKIVEFMRCVGAFYRNCDKDRKFGKKSFAEAYKERVYASLMVNTISNFITELLKKLPMTEKQTYRYMTDFALNLSRQENMILLQWARENIDTFVASSVYCEESNIFKANFNIHDDMCELESDYLVPVIPGNSFRGKMRRLLMRYITDKIFDKNAHNVLNKTQYDTFFTGGRLTSQKGFIDVESKVKFREDFPFLSILGSMLGNEDLAGKLKIGFGILDCNETNPENSRMALSYLKEYFNTRKDDFEGIKTEKDGSSQMYYSCMAIETGSIINWHIQCNYLTDIEKSFFDLMLDLFMKNGFIGGVNRAGFGQLLIDLNGYELDTTLAEEFLIEKKEEIKENWLKIGVEKTGFITKAKDKIDEKIAMQKNMKENREEFKEDRKKEKSKKNPYKIS